MSFIYAVLVSSAKVTNYHKAGGLIHRIVLTVSGRFLPEAPWGSFTPLCSFRCCRPSLGSWRVDPSVPSPKRPVTWLVLSVSSVSPCPNVLSLVKTPLTGSGLTLAHYDLILI